MISVCWTSWCWPMTMTAHKAQGSEYPAVVIPVTTQHYPMLQRNLLYTGVTRGRKLVVLVAQPKAVAIAVKGQHGAQALVEAAGVAGGESHGGREERMNFAIIRGGNGRRHEVDFGDRSGRVRSDSERAMHGQTRASQVGMQRWSRQLLDGHGGCKHERLVCGRNQDRDARRIR